MPRPTVSNSQTRYQSIGVGEQGTLSTLDNALSQCLRFRIQPNRSVLPNYFFLIDSQIY